MLQMLAHEHVVFKTRIEKCIITFFKPFTIAVYTFVHASESRRKTVGEIVFRVVQYGILIGIHTLLCGDEVSFPRNLDFIVGNRKSRMEPDQGREEDANERSVLQRLCPLATLLMPGM